MKREKWIDVLPNSHEPFFLASSATRINSYYQYLSFLLPFCDIETNVGMV